MTTTADTFVKSPAVTRSGTNAAEPPSGAPLMKDLNERLSTRDRAYGKAPTFSTQDTTQFKRAIDMTDDELAAIASRATLHVVK